MFDSKDTELARESLEDELCDEDESKHTLLDSLLSFVWTPGDGAFTRMRKKTFLLFTLGGVIISFLQIPFLYPIDQGGLWFLSTCIGGASCFCGAAAILYTKKINVPFISMVLGMCMFSIILNDLHKAALRIDRSWYVQLLILMVAFVLRIPSLFFEVMTMAWMVLVAFESVWRFGLFDLPGTPGEEERWEWIVRDSTGCKNLPCRLEVIPVLLHLLGTLLVIGLQIFFVRSFIHITHRERRKVVASVIATEHVAEALAAMDLEAARLVLSRRKIPTRLHASLATIVLILEGYKPYLPRSCFPSGNDSTLEVEEADIPKDASSSCDSASNYNHLPRLASSSWGPGRESIVDLVARMSVVTASGTKSVIGSRLAAARVSVLCVTVPSTDSLLQRGVAEFSSLCETVVASLYERLEMNNGVLDQFDGSVFFGSFNTSRPCTSHSIRAARTCLLLADDLDDGDSNDPFSVSAVTTGSAICGDIGCRQVKRFCVMGHVTSALLELSRAAVELRTPVACNSAMTNEIAGQLVAELHVARCRFPSSPAALSTIWVLHNIEMTSPGSEWMYEIKGDDRWSALNEAIHLYHSADRKAALGLLGSARLDGARKQPRQHPLLFKAYSALQIALNSDKEAPILNFCVT